MSTRQAGRTHRPVGELFPDLDEAMRARLDTVTPAWKRLVMAFYHAIASRQRAIGEASLADWPPMRPTASVKAHLYTLSCERDRLMLVRMLRSFFEHVGRPRRFVVVSDGSISDVTRECLTNLDPSVTIQDWRDCLEPPTPNAVGKLAERHPMGKKLATMCAMTRAPGVARGYIDSDIEFFRGAFRLRELLEAMSDRPDEPPRYLQDSDYAYDGRVVGVTKPAPRINAGLVLTATDLSWDDATANLAAATDPPFSWTEQTIVAIALTLAGAKPLPPDLYRMIWSDMRVPWDSEARGDIVCRHYASWMLQWKMVLRGGPRGYATLPRAAAGIVATAVASAPRSRPAVG